MKPFSDTFLRPNSPGCVGQCPSLPCRHPAACSSLHPPRAQRLQDSSWQAALPSASGRTEPSSSSFSSSSPCAGPPRQDFPLGSPAERRCGRRWAAGGRPPGEGEPGHGRSPAAAEGRRRRKAAGKGDGGRKSFGFCFFFPVGVASDFPDRQPAERGGRLAGCRGRDGTGRDGAARQHLRCPARDPGTGSGTGKGTGNGQGTGGAGQGAAGPRGRAARRAPGAARRALRVGVAARRRHRALGFPGCCFPSSGLGISLREEAEQRVCYLCEILRGKDVIFRRLDRDRCYAMSKQRCLTMRSWGSLLYFEHYTTKILDRIAFLKPTSPWREAGLRQWEEQPFVFSQNSCWRDNNNKRFVKLDMPTSFLTSPLFIYLCSY